MAALLAGSFSAEARQRSGGPPLLEAPAGTLDVAGEEPAVAARRELREEVGVEADELLYLGSSFNSPGFCDQVTHLYLARDLRSVGRELTGSEEVFSTVAEMALDDLLASSETMDSTTRQLALLALRHLGR
ncbi:MAG: NUDIX hydrolase [Actinobacteria bacterium]|nr:NUDIX hydrolase [Actinomycetota bacterium]